MELSALNPQQQKVATTTEGPMMILAGAGSGKTRTLVSRLHYLMAEKNISPYQILAVTFSNKAAREMRERVSQVSGIDTGALQITTFHAFCARLLRSEATYLGLSRNFTIYDDGESLSVIKAILSQKGISQKEVPPKHIKYYINEIKNLGYYPGCDEKALGREGDNEVDRDHEFFDYYLEYENELARSNAVDFGGLITGVIQLFETHPEVLERYQKRFQYLLVDEYQDTNRAQFMLIHLLGGGHRNVCVVGDEDQSIYSWRGADIRNILDFEKIFNEAQILRLEQNYRSSKNIIQAASHLIERNTQRKGKKMWTDNEEGEQIQIIECRDDRMESETIAQEIVNIHSEGARYSDIAVFYRNNAQSRMIEDALLKKRLPYRVVAGIKFYERKEIKDILAYMRLVTNPQDSLALSRIINIPARGIGVKSLRKLEEESVRHNQSLWQTLVGLIEDYDTYSHLKLSARIRSALNQFVSVIQEAQILDADEHSVPFEVYEKLLGDSGYHEMLKADKSYESQARLENLDELYNAIVQHNEEVSHANLSSFLESITLDSQVDIEGEESSELISLMTVHGSKGLEYPYVFVTGAEENIFPSYMSIEEGEWRIEEERRLFYVAMTRAMKRLYILYARGRMLFGSLKFNGPSRFLDEIPSQYCNIETTQGVKEYQDSNSFVDEDGIDYSDEFSQESYDQDQFYHYGSSSGSSFSRGMPVRHQLYGQGIVLDSQGAGQDEKVTVQFPGGVKKKFMVKYAPLEVLHQD